MNFDPNLGQNSQDFVGNLVQNQADFVHDSDSDWGGDLLTRRSPSGDCIVYGRHLVQSWARTQQVVSLSSAEAEFYALVKCAGQALGLQAMMMDLGRDVTIYLKIDASAAAGIAMRRGLGKVRHIDCSFLYIQQLNTEKVLKFDKIPGAQNASDMCTKGLPQESILRYMRELRCEFIVGRSELASRVDIQ